MMVRNSGDDGSKARGSTVSIRTRELCPTLIGCPEAIMMHDTCHPSIGYYLGSKCRFVFHALPL